MNKGDLAYVGVLAAVLIGIAAVMGVVKDCEPCNRQAVSGKLKLPEQQIDYGGGQCREPRPGEILAVYKWNSGSEVHGMCEIVTYPKDSTLADAKKKAWRELL